MKAGPLTIPWLEENLPAILEAWGDVVEGDDAIADVLFGNVNPAGRLPHTIYASESQVPPQNEYDITNYRCLTALLEGAEPTPNQITRIARCFDLTQADLLMKDLGRVSTVSQASSVPADHPTQRQQLENPPAQVPATCPI